MAKRMPKQSQPETRPQPIDAVQLLKADHRQFRKLFQQCNGAPADEKGALAARLFATLDIHGKVEEELIYPAVRDGMETESSSNTRANGAVDHGDDGNDSEAEPLDGEELDIDEDEEESEELLPSAYEGHQIMKDLIQQLRSVEAGSDDYRELFGELEEIVIEHVAEEEEEMFPWMAEHLDIQALGVEVRRRTDELASQSTLAA